MFVVLDGTLEVRDGDRLLRVLGPGDVLGEIAFLVDTLVVHETANLLDLIIEEGLLTGGETGALECLQATPVGTA